MTTELYAHRIRYYVIDMIERLGFGHLGGSLSIADILAVLYNEEFHVDPSNPNYQDRDYFVLSKGHGGPALYATLALKGFFPTDKLYTLNKAPTMLPSHPDRLLVPGVDATTGSLGQGISQAVGIALGLSIKNTSQRVYSILGDGELQEGQCWEAFQHAGHQALSNLMIFIDFNKLQLDGNINTISNPFDIAEKIKSFGWNVISIDGHNQDQIKSSFAEAKKCTSHPTAVIAHTIKGKGVPEFEQNCPHHLRIDDKIKSILISAKDSFSKFL
ncbi:MAG: transketolase [Brevinemataceae bacterium]